ncbi:VWA domain-containing protein [Clostridium sp. 19966]|uniref:VWA domain-containing protein n=1 Tax=Clostridium sp. 19966 TaxID=2768166 RepID=UPI0028DD7E9E|nr:VWA domain-containing protein [Clostridium sp. 19966]MDT8715477.1 VWA domain-containing protein [Clostridium sp. 19966]
MKKRLPKMAILVFIIFICAQFITVKDVKADTTVVDNYLALSKSAANTKGESGTNISAKGGEQIALNYNITSQDIPSSNVNTQSGNKKIVLVIDTSGSMNTNDMDNGKSRIYTAKSAATNFVNNIVSSTVDVAIVTYSDYAGSYNNITDFSHSTTTLDNAINNISANGGTNIGDGLRKAYYMLNGLDDNTYKKYIVLLTDGQPNEWSIKNGTNSFYTGNGNYWYDYNYNAYDNNDSTGNGLKYADTIGDMVGATKINTFMIGFTADTSTDKMNTMASHAKAQISFARDTTGLNSVYNSISNQILNSFNITNVNFREQFPSDATIVSVPSGFTIDNTNHVVTGTLSNMIYTLNNNVYKLSSVPSFEIDIKFPDNTSGSKILSNAALSYTDYNNKQGSKQFNSVTLNLSPAIAKITQAPISFSRSVAATEYSLTNGTTDNINVQHSIIPQNIDFYSVAPDDYFKNKYIVIVTDTSGSMAWDLNGNQNPAAGNSRLDILKSTLVSSNGFINEFIGNGNVNIGLVDYASQAKLGNEINPSSSDDIKDSNGTSQDFANMGQSTQVSQLTSQVSNLSASGGTNLGDGLRRAYWLLSKVDSNAQKYIVLMTDGYPTAFSYNSMNPLQYNFDDGIASNYYVNGGESDNGNNSLNYGTQMASTIANSNSIGSYIIGFSNGINHDKLTSIANSAKGTYKEAQSASDLQGVYNQIAGQISNDLPIKNTQFTTTIPKGLTVQSIVKSDGTTFPTNKYTVSTDGNGNSVVSFSIDDMGGINYTLNAAKTYFQASPINFTLVLKGNAVGSYTITKDSTYLTYTDIGAQTTTLNSSNDISFSIYQSRVKEHGLYNNIDSSIKDSNFTFSTVSPINAVNGTIYKGGVVAEITGPSSPLTINLGKAKNAYDTNNIVVQVIKLDNNGNYTDSSIITPNITKTANSDNTATITVNLQDKGSYLITYTFKMDAPDGTTSFVNTASIGSSSQNLSFSLSSGIPDLF